LRFSYSKLNVFLTCPLQFKFKYIDKSKSEEITDNYSTYLGRGVHECLQYLYENKDKDWQYLENKWITTAGKILEESEEKTPEVFKDLDTVKMFKNHGRKILKIFFESHKDDFKNPNHLTIALEKSFATSFKEFTLTGIIDKVEKIEDNIFVVDYKTGKVPSQQEIDENLQLSFYAVACRKAGLALSKVQFCMHYVKHNVRIFTQRNIEDIRKLYNILKEVQDKINNNQFDPTPSASACLYCGFKEYCSAYKKPKKVPKNESK
jgi:CRISPR/Cas system-associated exonuclease Cas4 (RecB family)